MDNKTKTILVTSVALLGVAGLVFLAVNYKPSETTTGGQSTTTTGGLLSAIADFFNPIKGIFTKK